MNSFSMNFVAGFAGLLTTALIHFLWQGAVLTLILLVTVKLLDVRTARLRYLLSVCTLLMMGLAPIVTAMWHHQTNSQPQHSRLEVSGRSNPIIDEHTAINAINANGRAAAGLQIGSATSWNRSIEFALAPADAAGTWWAVGFVAMILPFAATVAFSVSAGATPSAANVGNESTKSKASEKIACIRPMAKAVTVTEKYVGQIHSRRHIDVCSLLTGYLKAISIVH